MGAASSCRMAKLVEPSRAMRKNDRRVPRLAVVDTLGQVIRIRDARLAETPPLARVATELFLFVLRGCCFTSRCVRGAAK